MSRNIPDATLARKYKLAQLLDILLKIKQYLEMKKKVLFSLGHYTLTKTLMYKRTGEDKSSRTLHAYVFIINYNLCDHVIFR